MYTTRFPLNCHSDLRPQKIHRTKRFLNLSRQTDIVYRWVFQSLVRVKTLIDFSSRKRWQIRRYFSHILTQIIIHIDISFFSFVGFIRFADYYRVFCRVTSVPPAWIELYTGKHKAASMFTTISRIIMTRKNLRVVRKFLPRFSDVGENIPFVKFFTPRYIKVG